jgi:hypothetical protein
VHENGVTGSCPCSNFHKAEKDWRFSRAGHTVTVMVTILCALDSIFEFRVRSRASLELELIALLHQVTVLRRQHRGRPRPSSIDRLLWVWLYRIWPQVINAMVLVKPATVVPWHRKGFRLYWRWRSCRPGRPRIGTEIRDLIRCVCRKPRPLDLVRESLNVGPDGRVDLPRLEPGGLALQAQVAT